MGGIVRTATHAVSNIVHAPVNLVKNVAAGKNVAESVAKSGGQFASGVLTPVVAPTNAVLKATGADKVLQGVPIVGSGVEASKNIGDANLKGGFTKQSALQTGKDVAIVGAAAAGAAILAPALGASGGLEVGATTLASGSVATKLLSGNVAGAVGTAADAAVPYDTSGLGDFLNPILQSDIKPPLKNPQPFNLGPYSPGFDDSGAYGLSASPAPSQMAILALLGAGGLIWLLSHRGKLI